jgi:hypothetical protein
MNTNVYYFIQRMASRSTVRTPKANIPMPTSASDCQIVLKRTNEQITEKKTSFESLSVQMRTTQNEIEKLQKQLSELQKQHAQVQTQLSQLEVNRVALEKVLPVFIKKEENDVYTRRCKEFINQYDWVNPESFEHVSDKKILPKDLFDFLKIHVVGEYDSYSKEKYDDYLERQRQAELRWKFSPLEEFTSDELKLIAHYLKACELIAQSKKLGEFKTHNILYNELTYFELTNNLNYSRDSEIYLLDDIRHCDGQPAEDMYENDTCCHRRYCTAVSNFYDINLDTRYLVSEDYRVR